MSHATHDPQNPNPPVGHQVPQTAVSPMTLPTAAQQPQYKQCTRCKIFMLPNESGVHNCEISLLAQQNMALVRIAEVLEVLCELKLGPKKETKMSSGL